jgi:hypothetical protein
MGRPYDVNLLNWQLSVFWAFVGTVSLATCVSSTNKRIRAEVRLWQPQPHTSCMTLRRCC